MRILIVEDEAPAGRMLKSILQRLLGDRIESIQIQTSVIGSECFIWERPIDLLFLDLDVGGKDGFEILKQATAGSFQTIVVSGHSERAIEAFEYGVLDFVAKPYTEERIEAALDRFEGTFRSGGLKYLSIPLEGKILLVPLEEVRYFEACDKRSLVCRKDGRVDLCNKMLQDIERILPQSFVRIHRSFIVAFSEIAELGVKAGGGYSVSIRNGDVLPVSRTIYPSLRKRITEQASRFPDAVHSATVQFTPEKL